MSLPIKIELPKLASSAKVIAVAAADLHLDDGNWVNSGIIGDSRWSFSYVHQLAKQQRVPLLLLGDVIDVKRPSSETISFLRDDLADGAPVYFIQGQHELADPPWLTVSALIQSTHMDGELFTISGVNFYGLDWTPADRLAERLARIQTNTDVVLTHQVWEQFMGSVTSPEGSLADILHASLALTGDYHKYAAIKVPRPAGGPLRVYSPGATHMRKIDEPSKHYLLLIHKDLAVSRVQIPTRKVIRLSFDQQSQIDDLLANLAAYEQKLGWATSDPVLPPELHKPLLRITYPERLSSNYDALAERLAEKYHLFWKCVVEDRPEDAEALAASRRFRQLGPVGCLNQVVPDDSEDFKSLTRLLSSTDQRAELQTMKKERGL